MWRRRSEDTIVRAGEGEEEEEEDVFPDLTESQTEIAARLLLAF